MNIPQTYLSKGIKRGDMKFRLDDDDDDKNILSLSIGFLILLASIATVTQFSKSLVSTNPSQNIDLGKPFLVEHYQINTGKPETTNNSIFLNFTGKGIINSTVNITADGNATEIFRNNDTSYIQGKAKYVTDSKDIASYDFYAISNYHPDGSFDRNGGAIFDNGATGRLSALSNSAGIYKDHVERNGTGTFLMWHWK
ncbi:MAG: hypothetical protein ACTHME_10135 [Candidatus Nitrosocosmicus sp.]